MNCFFCFDFVFLRTWRMPRDRLCYICVLKWTRDLLIKYSSNCLHIQTVRLVLSLLPANGNGESESSNFVQPVMHSIYTVCFCERERERERECVCVCVCVCVCEWVCEWVRERERMCVCWKSLLFRWGWCWTNWRCSQCEVLIPFCDTVIIMRFSIGPALSTLAR